MHAQHGPVQPRISNLAQKDNSHDSFNELMNTPLDFLAFVMNRLKIDALTLELLAGPTFELMKGSCKSLVELEYFLAEVCKATIAKLDWNNPEGQQYPHDLRKPLPLITNSEGPQVIPFKHFINNDLAYLNGDDANKHLDKFLHVTQSNKLNEVTDDAFRLYLFPHSLTHHATAWFDHFPRNSINTFEQMAKMFLGKYFPPFMVTKLRNEITNFRQRPDELLFEAWERYKLSIDRCRNHNMLPITKIDTFYNGLTLRHRDTINAVAGGTFMKRRPEESYDLIENITTHHNDWDTSSQRSKSSSSVTSSSDPIIIALKAKRAEINKNLMKILQINQQVKAVTPNCETCGGPHSYNDCPTTVGQTQNVYAVGANQGGNSYQPQGNRNLLSYRSDNYLGPPGFNKNQNRNNQNQNFQNQNKNQGNNHGIPLGNNQGRNRFFQGASHGQNSPPAYQVPAYQAPGYQAPVHQPLIPQP
nr:reverse transcriptase domain-containing protein [Tanacetum cinerariifolium]